jgi:hypothetical protein
LLRLKQHQDYQEKGYRGKAASLNEKSEIETPQQEKY